MVVISSFKLTLRRLFSSCNIGFWSAGVYGGHAEPLTTLMSLPVPGVSWTDLKACLGKLIQASSMPGPVLGRSGFCGPVTGTYAGSRLASLVWLLLVEPLPAGAAGVLGAGLVHAARTPMTARPKVERRKARREV